MKLPPFPLPLPVMRAGIEIRNRLQDIADASLPPGGGLYDLTWGVQRTKIAGTLVTSGLANAIDSLARTPVDLANELNLNSDVTIRFIDAAIASRLLRIDGGGRVKLTRLGAPLCSNHPYSISSWVAFMADPDTAAAYQHLDVQLREGPHPSGWRRTFDQSIWEYFLDRPEAGARFANSMRQLTAAFDLAGLTRAYPWPRRGVVCDIGGGTGQLLAAILQRRAGAQGILLDSEQVIAEAQSFLNERGLAGRIRCCPGSFFEPMNIQADVYIMKWIMHDWDDNACRAILTHVRDTMPSGSRLVTIDVHREPGRPNFLTSMIDLGLLVLWEGRERSPDEVQQLMCDAGLKPGRVRHTGLTMLVEGIAP